MNLEFISIYITGRYQEYVENIKRKIKQSKYSKLKLNENPNTANVIVNFDQIELDIEHNDTNAIKILLRQEPFLVAPENYRIRNLSDFDLVLSVGSTKDNQKYQLDWPQQFTNLIERDSYRITDRQVLINSNLISLYKSENYSLRRIAINELDSVDLYGHGWDKTFFNKVKELFIQIIKYFKYPSKLSRNCLKYYFRKPINYVGSIPNKYETLSQYKVSIVIENSSEYISEKLFDCFLAGTLPVYVGPNLDIFEIPKNLYFRADPTIKGISEAVEKAKKVDYDLWRANLKIWLNEEDTIKRWSDIYFVDKIEKLIIDFLTSSNHLQR